MKICLDTTQTADKKKKQREKGTKVSNSLSGTRTVFKVKSCQENINFKRECEADQNENVAFQKYITK